MSAAVFRPRRAGPTRRSPRAPGMRRSPSSRHVAAAARTAALHARLGGSAPRPRTREPGRDCRLPRECRRRDAGAPETIARVRVPMPADPMARTGTSLQDTHPHRRIGSRPRRTANWGGTCAAHRQARATRGTFRNALPGRVPTRGSPVIKTARASYRPPDRAGVLHRAPARTCARSHTAVPRPRREFQRRPGRARLLLHRSRALCNRSARSPARGARRAHAEVSATATSNGWTLRLAADRQAPACRQGRSARATHEKPGARAGFRASSTQSRIAGCWVVGGTGFEPVTPTMSR